MDDSRVCIQCGKPLGNRRLDAVFCRQKCKRRYYRQRQSSNYLPAGTAGTGGMPEDRADERWRQQYSRHEEASAPLSPEDHELLARQRRNPGVLLPELRAKQLDQAAEQQRREPAERASHSRPIKPETPLDPSSLGSVARRARESRRINKPQDPHLGVLRPVPSRSRPPGWDDLPECIDKRDIGWG